MKPINSNTRLTEKIVLRTDGHNNMNQGITNRLLEKYKYKGYYKIKSSFDGKDKEARFRS